MSWIVGNSFSLEQKKIDPEDKSIEELMTDKKSWIFEGNKPARICSQILLRLSVLSSKKSITEVKKEEEADFYGLQSYSHTFFLIS